MISEVIFRGVSVCKDTKKTGIIIHGNRKQVSEGSWEMRRCCVSVWGQSLSNHQSAGSLVVLLQSKSVENGGLLLRPVRVEQFSVRPAIGLCAVSDCDMFVV